jgi:hypothetical protein
MDKLTRNMITGGLYVLAAVATRSGATDAAPVFGTLIMVWTFYLASSAPKPRKAVDFSQD